MLKNENIHTDVSNFTIERSKWQRSEKLACLLNPVSNKMCCLGFYAKSCGFSNDEILDVTDPEQLPEDYNWKTFLLENESETNKNTQDCYNLMIINDDETILDSLREEKIAKIFTDHNIKVNFVD